VRAVGLKALLVAHESLPGDVAGVVTLDHDAPLFAWQHCGPGADRAVGVDVPAAATATEHVGTGVGRVAQHGQRAAVRQAAVAQLPGPRAAVGAGRETPLGERADHRVGRAGLLEAREDVRDRCADLLIGVHDDAAVVVVVDVAHGEREAQLAALGGRSPRALQAPGEQVQLGFGHRALQAE
jgi:hypothetical protein